MTALHPVILCGGSGARLWPSSRQAYPKQFAPLLGPESLFQSTLRRLSGPGLAAPLVMTGEPFRFMATDQARAIGLADARVVIEPAPRNTAPAVLAAALLLETHPDDLILVAPSDHVIGDVAAFRAALDTARDAARDGALVTFGVRPDGPATGYGYLDLAGPPLGPTEVRCFTEKPDAARAAELLASGTCLWNAGLVLARVGDLLAAFHDHAPDLLPPVRAAVDAAREDLGFTRLGPAPFETARSISLDHAVLEKARTVVAVPLDCSWSDLGAWDAVWAVAEKDANGTATEGDAVAIDCEGSLLKSEEPGLVLAGLGLKNIIAVAMRDAVLVADKSRAQEVRAVVDALAAAGRAQATDHPRFHRPWGWYETLSLGRRFQVKRIVVRPGGVLSLQSHRHRAEHWVVVSGEAEVTIGDETRTVTENQSVYVPLGVRHRLANRGDAPMHLIEVQTGAYLGEDDILRYDDVYDRT